MKFVTFRHGVRQLAINPARVAVLKQHISNPQMTIVAFSEHEDDFLIVEEELATVVRKLEDSTP